MAKLKTETNCGITKITTQKIGKNYYTFITPQITNAEIIRYYRDMGLRGKITLELGE